MKTLMQKPTYIHFYQFEIFVIKAAEKQKITRLILFSNSEPPRLRDVVSHLITIETSN